MSGTVVFEDAKLQAVELIAETVTLNNFSVSTATTFQQTTNASNVTTNTLKFTNPATAFVTTGNVEVGGELTVGSNVEIGTANLFVDTTTGRVGVGTSSPGTLLELSKSTGSATISPTELRLSTTTNAADWSVTDPWARLSFYTDDVTADAPGVMASVGAVASSADGGENTRLAFFTAEPHVERMCIDRYGNVGIGTTSPSAPLHILGEGGSSDNSATDLSTSVDKAKLRFQSRSGSSLSQYHGTTDSGSTWYQQIANGGGTTSYDMVFNPFGGNVGIGTSSPLQPLNVKANGTNPVIYMTDATNNRYASGMGSNHVSNEGQRLDFYNGDSGANGTSLSSGHIRMSINASGNVGIGTTGPLRKLQVDGDVLIGDRLPYNNQNYTSAQLILGGTHNSSTYHNSSDKIKLLISGGDNDSASPYYIMCEDENGYNQFWVKGGTQGSTSVSNATMYLNGTARINDIGFAAYRSGGGDSTYTGTVVFNNEYYDHGSDYSTSTGKFTAPVDGIYRFGFNGFTNQGATTASRIYLYKNESIYIQKGNSIDRHGNCIDTLIKLAANDTVSIRGHSSNPMYFYRSQGHNIFYGHLITGL